MRAQAWNRLAGSFLLGAVTVAGFAPFYLFPLPALTLAWLMWTSERVAMPAATFKLGFAFGLGYFLAGVSWVYVSLHDFGTMPAAVAAAMTVLFCAYLALFPACALWAVARIPSSWLRRCVAFPGAWIIAEWVRSWLFTGFPWLAIGYSQAPYSPLAGIAPVLGLHGVGLLTVASAGLLLQAMTAERDKRLVPPLAALALVWALAGGSRLMHWTTPVGEPVSVSLLQGNVAQSMKWRPEQIMATLNLYEGMIRASAARLIILPETAVPLFLQDVPKAFLDRVAEHARAQGADVLIGLPELGADRSYFNSVVSLGVSPSQAYRKSHLVPFGEFIPLRPLFAPLVQAMAIPLTDFSRGEISQQPLAVAGQAVAVNICYEDAFGEEIIRQLPQATLLVNASNVAWFGDSIAPMQHLQISQMRAIETGRPMLRATNTGVTAAIDERGNVIAMAPTFQTASVQANIRGYTGATPYVRFGNAVPIALAAAALLVPVALSRSRT